MEPLPRVLVVDPRSPDARVVSEAAAVLRRGRLVALPTETVYGLAARALDPSSVARIFAAKGRPTHHPLIVHVLDEDGARALAASWPARASALAQAFWPGPLTLVVERAPRLDAAVAGGGDSIALRAPSHAVARAVIEALGEPVAAPSANRYQGLSPTTAAHVVKELGAAADLVLDAGPCHAGIESTVVDVRGATARVLRPGAISSAALRAVVPELDAGAAAVASSAPRASPGMGLRHYAPRAQLHLAASVEAARSQSAELAAGGTRVGLVVREASKQTTGGSIVVRVLPADAEGYARALYGALHELDDAGVGAIVVHEAPAEEAWWAVADRLRRASQRE
ncbi:MAG TPA: L-threonylcarbamoyladenylate synthase [Polyangiaceae bacterium]